MQTNLTCTHIHWSGRCSNRRKIIIENQTVHLFRRRFGLLMLRRKYSLMAVGCQADDPRVLSTGAILWHGNDGIFGPANESVRTSAVTSDGTICKNLLKLGLRCSLKEQALTNLLRGFNGIITVGDNPISWFPHGGNSRLAVRVYEDLSKRPVIRISVIAASGYWYKRVIRAFSIEINVDDFDIRAWAAETFGSREHIFIANIGSAGICRWRWSLSRTDLVIRPIQLLSTIVRRMNLAYQTKVPPKQLLPAKATLELWKD